MSDKKNIANYANALFSIWSDLADNKSKIKFTNSAKEVYFSIKNNYEIINILHSNNINKFDRKTILKQIYENDLNACDESQIIFNFLNVLIDNNFFNKILEIFIAFFEKLDNFQNFTFIRIYSKYFLDAKLLKQIEELFAKKTKKRIKYENVVDKSLIGGIKIKFGDQIFDYSIKGKIEQIKWNLENNMEDKNVNKLR